MSNSLPKKLSKVQFHDSAAQCADAAAPIFRAKRWRWWSGIPDREDILTTLMMLERMGKNRTPRYCETGRLVYHEGRFGHYQ